MNVIVDFFFKVQCGECTLKLIKYLQSKVVCEYFIIFQVTFTDVNNEILNKFWLYLKYNILFGTFYHYGTCAKLK